MKLTNRKKQVFPTKKSLNLMQKDTLRRKPYRMVLIGLALCLVVAGVFKFGVFDRMYALYAANAAADEALKQLEVAKANTANYEELNAQYARYTFSGFTEAELARVDRMDMIRLVDSYFLTAGTTAEYTIAGNVISMNLNGVTLSETSELLQRLYSNSMVESVVVSTAQTKVGQATSVDMTITVKKVEVEQ